MQNETAVNPYEMFEVKTEAENTVGLIAQYPVKGFDDKSFQIRFVHSGDTNVPFRDYLRARLKPLNYRINQEMVTDEEYENILIEVFAEKVIKEWKVQDGYDDKGKPVFVEGIYGPNFTILPFNKENVIATFKQGRRLFKDIKRQSDNFASFRDGLTNDTIKN